MKLASLKNGQRDGALCRAGETDHPVAGFDHRQFDVHRHKHLILHDENATASGELDGGTPGVGILRVDARFW